MQEYDINAPLTIENYCAHYEMPNFAEIKGKGMINGMSSQEFKEIKF